MRSFFTVINTLLGLALIAMSLYAIEGQTLYRDLGARIVAAQALAHNLEEERKALEAEKSHATSSSKIEQRARQQLHMQLSSPASTLHVQLPGPSLAQQSTGGAQP